MFLVNHVMMFFSVQNCTKKENFMSCDEEFKKGVIQAGVIIGMGLGGASVGAPGAGVAIGVGAAPPLADALYAGGQWFAETTGWDFSIPDTNNNCKK